MLFPGSINHLLFTQQPIGLINQLHQLFSSSDLLFSSADFASLLLSGQFFQILLLTQFFNSALSASDIPSLLTWRHHRFHLTYPVPCHTYLIKFVFSDFQKIVNADCKIPLS